MIDKFLGLPRVYKRLVSVFSDMLVLLIAIWASFALRLEQGFWLPTLEHVIVAVVTVVFTIAVFIRVGLYRAVIRFLGSKAFLTIIYSVFASAIALIVIGYLMRVQVPRSVPIIYGALAFLFVSGTRLGVRAIINRSGYRNKEIVAIVGVGETGIALASALRQGTVYQPALFIALDRSHHKSTIDGLPVVSLDRIGSTLLKKQVQRVLLALEPQSSVSKSDLLSRLEALGLPVQTVPSVSELVAGRARINDIRDLALEDLLGRDAVNVDNEALSASLSGQSVMVTGAGGSIGSELCRQIIRHRPSKLVLFEQNEYSLYRIERELKAINQVEGFGVQVFPLLGNVAHRRRSEAVMRSFGVQAVYHAAAYKHVPLVELNIIEGVQNNVFGTWHLAEAAIACGVERFVLVSTDKAVRPTSVMGASKRMAELVLQGLADNQSQTVFSIVRFGNVLGSSGSVVPLFRDQIRDGGPVTVTHPEVVRYFMTIPEASQLVLQAGILGGGGEIFVLDMGEPVKIVELARKMIRLMGFSEKDAENPEGDIEIVYTGLRSGEKLYEELLIGEDPQETAHSRIMMAREVALTWPAVERCLANLMEASRCFDCNRVISLLKEARTGYLPTGETTDLVWQRTKTDPEPDISGPESNIYRLH